MTPKSFRKVTSFIKSPKSCGAKQLPCATDNAGLVTFETLLLWTTNLYLLLRYDLKHNQIVSVRVLISLC